MSKELEPMTSGSISKSMIVFALPILLGNLFQQLYNTVDSLIVGNYLGSTALAAVTSSGSLIFMLIGFVMGVSSGASVVIANYYGARDKNNLELSVHTTVVLGVIVGAAMTILGVLLTPQILIWIDTPSAVMKDAVVYLRLLFSGSLFLVMYNFLVGILQAVGDSKHPLYYLIASSVINLILDVLFIAGFHMGVGGAAVATVISQGISMLLCFIQLTKSKYEYRLQVKKLVLDKEILKQLLKIGLPSGVQNSIIAFANIIVQTYINSFGEMAMAGLGVFSKIEGFAFLPITSFAMAITTFIGQNLGAHEFDRAKKGARFGIIITVLSAEAIGLIIYIFAPQLIGAFDSSPEVISYGVAKAHNATIFFFLLAYSHAIAAVCRGAGKAMVPMFVMLAFWCVIRVAFLAITIPITQSIEMLYWVYPLTWGLSSLAFFIYYRVSNLFEYEQIVN